MPHKFPTISEITALIVDLKRAYRPDAEGLDLTVSADGKGRDRYGWQTGDNSYTGGAYSYPHWAVVTMYPRSNSRRLAREIIGQWRDLTEWR